MTWWKTSLFAIAVTFPKMALYFRSSRSTRQREKRRPARRSLAAALLVATDLAFTGSPGVVARTLESSTAEERGDWGVMQEKIRQDLKRYLNKQTQRRPLIMPVILEVNLIRCVRKSRMILRRAVRQNL